ncbi:UDP-N-acetylglucosamine 2-epimerase [Pseudodesulfovibrio senegalensis]|nr:UDP-N-acetylglucosamine 2-epimerase [Pseudodesulfovibrio senegalensis]
MKKILFLTGTRADFGKLKPLIVRAEALDDVEVFVFVTGMHMMRKYGYTHMEVEYLNLPHRIHGYVNQNEADTMDTVLAKTVSGLSDYVKEVRPDMIVVHGDRVEALAGASVGSLNNILVAHVEGGEVSGTVDELIRHAVSKLSHVHFVSNDQARARLLQLGETDESIFVIGSPDIDVMASGDLPGIDEVRSRYEFDFADYGVVLFHSVTTDLENLPRHVNAMVEALEASGNNHVVVHPNNDPGNEIIRKAYERLEGNPRFRFYPSMRFEYFLSLLKHADYMVGNSSAGIREAPFYGVPSIDLGHRQSNRGTAASLMHVDFDRDAILAAIQSAPSLRGNPCADFGSGDSAEQFAAALTDDAFWQRSTQKYFVDM